MAPNSLAAPGGLGSLTPMTQQPSHPSPPSAATAMLPRSPLIDASALAVELGVSRAFVYEHAAELLAIRLGAGPRARLRFDPIAARDALSRYGSERSQPQNPSARAESERPWVPRRRSLATHRPQPGSILPSRPRKAASVDGQSGDF